MKDEAEANADADKKAKEEVEKLNAADALIFSTEKQLKEYGDKIPADKKAPIEEGLKKLKDAFASKNLAEIEAAQAELNTHGLQHLKICTKQLLMQARHNQALTDKVAQKLTLKAMLTT
jgi:molecular chaperone DnaK (HSP70)